MRKDNNSFKERFLRWKNGELVYENGRPIPHYADGTESDNTRVVNPKEERFRFGKMITDEMRLARSLALNYSEVGPAPQISQRERDINRLRAETRLWNERKLALGEATDEMMKSILDPRYIVAGAALGLIARGIGAAVNAGRNLYKGYKISRAIDKAVKGGIVSRPTPKPAVNGEIDFSGFKDNFKANDVLYNYFLGNTLAHSRAELEKMPAYERVFNLDGIVDTNLTDLRTIDIFYNSVLPRVLFMRPGYRGGILYPTVKSKVTRTLELPYTIYPDEIFKNYKTGNFSGFFFPESRHLAVRRGYEDFAMGHEYRHLLDDLLPLTESEELFLSDAYGDDFVIGVPLNTERLKDVNMIPERVTTNFDARNKLLGDYRGTKWDWKEQNKMIDAVDDDRIFKAVEESNGYGQAYIELLRSQNKLTPYQATAFREAMKHVGGLATPVILSKPLFTNTTQRN